MSISPGHLNRPAHNVLKLITHGYYFYTGGSFTFSSGPTGSSLSHIPAKALHKGKRPPRNVHTPKLATHSNPWARVWHHRRHHRRRRTVEREPWAVKFRVFLTRQNPWTRERTFSSLWFDAGEIASSSLFTGCSNPSTLHRLHHLAENRVRAA